jgi:hypothetical protein
MAHALTESLAINALVRERLRRSLCIPRYTPKDWWECDLFEVTKSGYFKEYEIKLTLADFIADAKKTQRRWQWRGQIGDVVRNKHEHLAKGCPTGPVEFWFVTPLGLLDDNKSLLPTWAGLMELYDKGPGYHPHWRWRPEVVKAAPRLHETKIDPKIVVHATGVCYYRMHDLLYRRIKDMPK